MANDLLVPIDVTLYLYGITAVHSSEPLMLQMVRAFPRHVVGEVPAELDRPAPVVGGHTRRGSRRAVRVGGGWGCHSEAWAVACAWEAVELGYGTAELRLI